MRRHATHTHPRAHLRVEANAGACARYAGIRSIVTGERSLLNILNTHAWLLLYAHVFVAVPLACSPDAPKGCPDGQIKQGDTCVTPDDAFALTAVTPTRDATDVGLWPRLSLTFSTAVQASSLEKAFALHDANNANAKVPGTLRMDASGTALEFVPGAVLQANTRYTIRIEPGAATQEESLLQAPILSSFTTTTAADDDAPTLSISAVDGIISTPDLDAAGAFAFQGDAGDATSGIDWVGVQVLGPDAEPGPWWDAAALGDNGAWTYAWPAAAQDPTPLGEHTIVVRAVDKAGNVHEESLQVAVDLVPPSAPPTFVTPVPTQWKFKTLPIEVGGVADDGAFVAIAFNGESLAGSPFSVPDGSSLKISLQLLEPPDDNLLEVATVDAEGNRHPTVLSVRIARTGYTCLSEANGFPYPAAHVDADSYTDDDEGLVTLIYRLDRTIADDTYLNSADPTHNAGAEWLLGLGTEPESRPIVRFVNALVPACAEVDRATLVFTAVCINCPSADAVSAYALLRDWRETEVTWDRATASTAWSNGGADEVGVDRQGEAAATVQFSADAQSATLDIAALVQQWQKTGVNHGVLLRTSSNSAFLYPSEVKNEALRPRLELTLKEPE